MTHPTNKKAGVMTNHTTSREIPEKDIGRNPSDTCKPAVYDAKRLSDTSYQLGEDHTPDDTLALSLSAHEGDGYGRVLCATVYANHKEVAITARRITNPDDDYAFVSLQVGPLKVFLSEEQWATVKNQEV